MKSKIRERNIPPDIKFTKFPRGVKTSHHKYSKHHTINIQTCEYRRSACFLQVNSRRNPNDSKSNCTWLSTKDNSQAPVTRSQEFHSGSYFLHSECYTLSNFIFLLMAIEGAQLFFFFLAGDWRSVPSTHNERLSTAEPPPMCIHSRPPTHFKK